MTDPITTVDTVQSQPVAVDAPAQGQESTTGPYTKSFITIKIGPTEYSSLDGMFLGEPHIQLRTTQMSQVSVVLNDPNGEILGTLGAQDPVEVVIGFVDGPSQNVFVGNVFRFGSYPPDGTIVEALDKTGQLQNTGSDASYRAEQPAGLTLADATPDENLKAIATALDALSEDSAIAELDQQVSAIAALLNSLPPSSIEQANQLIQHKMGSLPTDAIATARLADLLQQALSDTNTPPEQTDGFSALQTVMEQLKTAVGGENTSQTAKLSADSADLRFADSSNILPSDVGDIRLQSTETHHAVTEAAKVGDVLVVRGNTIHQVAPGNGDSSGLVLDWTNNRGAFAGRPKVVKRTGMQLGGVGALTVQGWDASNKTMVGTTIVTPGQVAQHPTGNIEIPGWGAAILSEPIFPGCVYTWADATKNGSRVPTADIMERIIVIAQAIQPLTDQSVGPGNKWTITSWYRDPASNAAAGGASGSRHLSGDAVDVWFDGFSAFHDSIESSWPGGLAKSSSFMHVDARPSGKSRWHYGF